MVNLKFGSEIEKGAMIVLSRAFDKEIAESPTGIKPMTSQTLGGHSLLSQTLNKFKM